MRLAFFVAALVAAAPLGAQVKTEPMKFARDSAARADTVAIRLAMADSGGKALMMFVVGDNARVFGATEKPIGPDTTRDAGSITITEGVAFEHWEARVERRKGKWVQVSRKKQ